MRIARGISVTNTSKPISTAIVYDADAAAFFTAASITDTTQKNAVNQLVLDLKSASIWTKMKALYPVVGGVASSHAVNLKQPGTYNLSFATGWTHASTGMTPNGATYANTSFITNILTANSNHLGIYSRTGQAANAVPIGAYFDGSQFFQMNISTGTGLYYYDGSISNELASSLTNATGFFLGTARSSNDRKTFRNAIQQQTKTTVVNSSYPNLNMYIGARNFNGTANAYTSQQIAFASIGDGLTDAESSSFYTAVQTYQTTLGRQV